MLGKTIIVIGLIVLLFGIFQLWGTGIIEARAQQTLEDDFNELLDASRSQGPEESNRPVSSTPEPTSEPTNPPATIEAPSGPDAAPPSIQDPEPPPASSPTEGPEPATATPTPTPEPTPDPEWLALLYRDPGLPIARIEIPRINLNKTVVEGVRVSDLRKGPGHYPNTPLPGQAGNAAIAGHRTTYGAPFGDIDELVPGDQIKVTTIQGEFTYEVVEQGDGYGHIIVPPSAIEVLSQNFRDHPNRLTLTACHPKGSSRQRIIVVAELMGETAPTYPRPGEEPPADVELADEEVSETTEAAETGDAVESSEAAETATPTTTPTEPDNVAETPGAEELAGTAEPVDDAATAEPAPTVTSGPAPSEEEPPPASAVTSADHQPPGPTPVQATDNQASTDSFGEGLDGDSGGYAPAIMWGLAAAAIWFSAMFAAKRWRRLPSYAISALPFCVVLFMAFWQIDRVLPSY